MATSIKAQSSWVAINLFYMACALQEKVYAIWIIVVFYAVVLKLYRLHNKVRQICKPYTASQCFQFIPVRGNHVQKISTSAICTCITLKHMHATMIPVTKKNPAYSVCKYNSLSKLHCFIKRWDSATAYSKYMEIHNYQSKPTKLQQRRDVVVEALNYFIFSSCFILVSAAVDLKLMPRAPCTRQKYTPDRDTSL